MKRIILILMFVSVACVLLACKSTSEPAEAESFSPKIAFISSDTYTTNLAVIDPDGSNHKLLTDWQENGQGVIHFQFYDRDHILVAEQGFPDSISLINIDSKERTFIYAWSSDLSSFELSTDKNYIIINDLNDGIGITDIDGSNFAFLFDGMSIWPTLSPDGSKIMFVNRSFGDYWLYIMNSNGSNQVKISGERNENYIKPAFHPSEDQILYMHADIGVFPAHIDLYTASLEGTFKTKIDSNLRDFSFSLSNVSTMYNSDGSEILYNSAADGDFEIYTIDPDGNNRRQLTQNTMSDIDPTYSPNDEKIAFITDRDGTWELYIMNSDGGDQMRLPDDAAIKRMPRFQPKL